MTFKDLIQKIRKKKRVPQQYDIERFKREKLIISFENEEECEDFIKCCIAAGMNLNGIDINNMVNSYYNERVFSDYGDKNRLDYTNSSVLARMLIMGYGYRSAKCSTLLIKKDNISFPSKTDLMDFLR